MASYRADRDPGLPLWRWRVISTVSGPRCADMPSGGALVCLGGASSGALRAGTQRAWRGSRANARGETERRPSGDRAASEGTPSGGQRGNPQRGRASEPLWAFEQTLGSGASDITLAWAARSPRARVIRRLHLAAERGKTLGVLFRPRRAAQESSAAVLRLVVEPKSGGARITLLKSRGGARGSIEIVWPAR